MKKLASIIIGSILFICLPYEAHAFVGTLIGALAGAALYAAGGGLASIAIGAFGTTFLTVTSLLGFTALGAVAGTALSFLSSALTPDTPEPGFSSGTYSSPQPIITVEKGTPISECVGRCRIAGNVIRQNDPDDETWIKMIVAHCEGEIDGILGHYVNGKEWTELKNSNHDYWEHEGAEDQSAITNLFDDSETCDFRGLALTEYKLRKGNEISQVQNINVVLRGKKCLEIGQDSGGTESFTRNPAQILWDFLVKKKGYSTSNLVTNAFTALETYCDEILTGSNTEIRPPICSDDTVKATSYHDGKAKFKPRWAADKSKPLTGTHRWTSWLSNSAATNQRISIDLGIPLVVTGLTLENFHDTGASTDRGIQNFIVQGSNSAASFADTTFASAGWSDIETGLTATEHAASDASDPETFTWTNTTAYRYISLKITDNYGGTSMGIRDIALLGKSPRHTFDYNFDSKMSIVDAEKLICNSFNGKVIRSQGYYKPVWDGAKEHDGAGALQSKAVVFAFTMDNIVKGSFEYHRLDHPNTFIINYINAHNGFLKDMVIRKDNRDISQRGEIVYEETCWYITEKSTAQRRCNLKHNKGRYPDYVCKLTGFPTSQAVEIFDLVTVTHTTPSPAWSTKQFIVIDKDEDQYGRAIFTLEAYYSSVYDDREFEEQQTHPSASGDSEPPPDSAEESYGSDDETVSDPDVTYISSIYDGIEDEGGIIFGCDNAATLTFDDANTSDTIVKNASIEVYVTDGWAPFTFATSSNGYDFEGVASYETSERNATLNCADGDCGVDFDVYCDLTVTDACGTVVTATILNTAGGWTPKGLTGRTGDGGLCKTANGGYGEYILGYRRWYNTDQQWSYRSTGDAATWTTNAVPGYTPHTFSVMATGKDATYENPYPVYTCELIFESQPYYYEWECP